MVSRSFRLPGWTLMRFEALGEAVGRVDDVVAGRQGEARRRAAGAGDDGRLGGVAAILVDPPDEAGADRLVAAGEGAPAFSVTCPRVIGGGLCDMEGTAGDWAEAADEGREQCQKAERWKSDVFTKTIIGRKKGSSSERGRRWPS